MAYCAAVELPRDPFFFFAFQAHRHMSARCSHCETEVHASATHLRQLPSCSDSHESIIGLPYLHQHVWVHMLCIAAPFPYLSQAQHGRAPEADTYTTGLLTVDSPSRNIRFYFASLMPCKIWQPGARGTEVIVKATKRTCDGSTLVWYAKNVRRFCA